MSKRNSQMVPLNGTLLTVLVYNGGRNQIISCQISLNQFPVIIQKKAIYILIKAILNSSLTLVCYSRRGNRFFNRFFSFVTDQITQQFSRNYFTRDIHGIQYRHASVEVLSFQESLSYTGVIFNVEIQFNMRGPI